MEQLTAKQKKEWEAWLESCKRIQNGVAPIPNESEVDKQKRIKHLLDPANFQEFVNYYFGSKDADLAPFGWFHKEAVKDILVKRERNNIWEWPRECAKSVLGDVFIPCHLLLTGWLDGLILASENEDKACKLIGDLQAHLENNQRIIHDFGDFGITGSWISGYWQTKSGVGFWAFGLGQNPAGVRNGFKRPNLGIIDDADSRKKAKNQQLTKEAVDWIKGEFLGCLQTKDRCFIYANNRVAKEGITAHLVGDIEPDMPKNEGYKHIKVYWTEDPKTRELLMPEDGGKPCWKENYTINQCIDRIQDMGYRNAMRQLYHLTLEDGNIFKPEQLIWAEPLPLDQYDALVEYCDPSFSDTKTSDFKAIVLLGLKGRYIDVLWVWCRQTTPLAMVNAMFELKDWINELNPPFYDPKANVSYRKVNCRYYIEANMTQKMILKPLFTQVGEERNDYWEPRYDEEKKADKYGRIENMSPLFESGLIRFNIQLRKNKDVLKLHEQLLAFPSGHDDGPDALEGGISKLNARKKRKGKETQTRAGKFKRDTSKIG